MHHATRLRRKATWGVGGATRHVGTSMWWCELLRGRLGSVAPAAVWGPRLFGVARAVGKTQKHHRHRNCNRHHHRAAAMSSSSSPHHVVIVISPSSLPHVVINLQAFRLSCFPSVPLCPPRRSGANCLFSLLPAPGLHLKARAFLAAPPRLPVARARWRAKATGGRGGTMIVARAAYIVVHAHAIMQQATLQGPIFTET